MLSTILKITRIVNDKTIKSVSENSGVSYSCISELEAGKKITNYYNFKVYM